jgi:competence protein ComGC
MIIPNNWAEGRAQVRRQKRQVAAFTLIELLVLLVIVMVVLSLMVPALHRTKARAQRISCTSNLKQIGLSFKTWATDYRDRLPSQIFTNQAGELRPEWATNAYQHFLVMSNELSTPYILLCPSDSARVRTKDFGKLSNANVSYFVGLDADDNNPWMFLSGDRNLTNGLAITNRVLFLATNRPVGWTHEVHALQGQILLADGSVQQVTSSRLSAAVTNAGPENRLLMPEVP